MASAKISSASVSDENESVSDKRQKDKSFLGDNSNSIEVCIDQGEMENETQTIPEKKQKEDRKKKAKTKKVKNLMASVEKCSEAKKINSTKSVEKGKKEKKRDTDKNKCELHLPHPFRLNLMNEFTEVDTFIISMDSLLIEIMLHDYLSWVFGGQSLVVVYMMESFLKSFKDKSCQFQLVWFDDLENCFRGNPTALLMREIIKKHFNSIHLLKENIFNFQSPCQQPWADHVKKLSPSFLFCSNGTLDKERFPGFESLMFKECMTSLILHCFTFNLATVTFDGLHLNEATVFAYYYKPHKVDKKTGKSASSTWLELKSLNVIKNVSCQMERHINNLTNFWISVVDQVLSTEDNLINKTARCEAILQAIGCQQSVPLELRAQPLHFTKVFLKSCDAFIHELCFIAANTLHSLSEPVPFPVHDLIDGRFIAYFLQNENSGHFNSSNSSKDTSYTTVCVSETHLRNNYTLCNIMQPLKHPLFDVYATDVVKVINACIPETTNQSQTSEAEHSLFLDNRHWHSGKLIKEDFSKNQKEANAPNRIHIKKSNEKSLYELYESSLEDKPQVSEPNVEVKVQTAGHAGGNRFELLNDAVTLARTKAAETKAAREKASLLFDHVLQLKQSVLNKREKHFEKRHKISIWLFVKLDELLHKEQDGKKLVDFLPNANKRDVAARIWDDMFFVDKADLFLDMDMYNYRLAHVGHSIEIQSNPIADSRVEGFIPDGWQRELLDAVDCNQSALIIAPTSAGKTFISYYCIKKVLLKTKDGLVVFVCPTKALVNQVAATISVRFKHIKLVGDQALFGVFTRDIRKDVLNCRVLITVPQCLEIFFLSPQRQSWRKRLKYIIFDEVHCIGGGVGDILGSEVWEHIIQLAPCPYLALSATVGNVNVLHDWLNHLEQSKMPHSNRNVKLVHYKERYSELNLFMYNIFDTKSKEKLVEVNPITLCKPNMIEKFNQQLTARQIYNLWETKKDQVGKKLEPKHFFKQKHFLSRDDIRKYENKLKEKYALLILKNPDEEINLAGDNPNMKFQLSKRSEPFDEMNLAKGGIVKLIHSLQKRKMFPCLCFGDNRLLCENFALTLVEHFQKEEKKLNDRNCKKDKTHESQDDDENCTWTTVNNSNQTEKKLDKNVYDQVIKHLKLKDWNKSSTNLLLQCFERGIGYHHSGMTKTQKLSVEILFRAGFLDVVFATATLALGIHMPCKTVVITVDSPYLTPLQYRQMIGRAGRRGFDKNGNVILYSIQMKKIVRLLTAPLPNLRANLPFTVSYVLRLLALISYVEKNSESELPSHLNEICSLLKHSFITQTLALQREKLQKQLEHYFVFGCLFLKRIQLINSTLHPIGPAGIVTHLSYHEPGNLVFTYFLRRELFHEVCKKYNGNELNVKLVLIMSHLFTNTMTNGKDKAIVLDPLPAEFVSELKLYNNEVCSFYISFLKCLADNLSLEDSPHNSTSKLLPYSGIEIQTTEKAQHIVTKSILQKLDETKQKNVTIGGPIFALTGHVDSELDIMNLKLVYPLREGIYYDREFVPAGLYMQKNHRGQPIALNSYALDFFTGKTINEIVHENKLMDGDAFHLLKDFCLVLKAVTVALVEVGPGDDVVVQAFQSLAQSYYEKFMAVQYSYS